MMITFMVIAYVVYVCVLHSGDKKPASSYIGIIGAAVGGFIAIVIIITTIIVIIVIKRRSRSQYVLILYIYLYHVKVVFAICYIRNIMYVPYLGGNFLQSMNTHSPIFKLAT